MSIQTKWITHNLKTFPRPKNPLDWLYHTGKIRNEIYAWLDGLDAELREILRVNRQMGYDLFPSEGEKKLAQELLGLDADETLKVEP